MGKTNNEVQKPSPPSSSEEEIAAIPATLSEQRPQLEIDIHPRQEDFDGSVTDATRYDDTSSECYTPPRSGSTCSLYSEQDHFDPRLCKTDPPKQKSTGRSRWFGEKRIYPKVALDFSDIQGWIDSIGGRKSRDGMDVIEQYNNVCTQMEGEDETAKEKILWNTIIDYLVKRKIGSNSAINSRDLGVVFGIKLLVFGVAGVKIEDEFLQKEFLAIGDAKSLKRWDNAFIAAAKAGRAGHNKAPKDRTRRVVSRFEIGSDQWALPSFAKWIIDAAERNSDGQEFRYVLEAARAVMLYAKDDDIILRALRLLTGNPSLQWSNAPEIIVNSGKILPSDIRRIRLRTDLDEESQVKICCRACIHKMFVNAMEGGKEFVEVACELNGEKLAIDTSPNKKFLALSKNHKSDLLDKDAYSETSEKLKQTISTLDKGGKLNLSYQINQASVNRMLSMLSEEQVFDLLQLAMNKECEIKSEEGIQKNEIFEYKFGYIWQLLEYIEQNIDKDRGERDTQRKNGYWLLFVVAVVDNIGINRTAPPLGGAAAFLENERKIFQWAFDKLAKALELSGDIGERELNCLSNENLRDFTRYYHNSEGAQQVIQYCEELVLKRLTASIGDDRKFKELVNLFFESEYRISVERLKREFGIRAEHSATIDKIYWVLACNSIERDTKTPQKKVGALDSKCGYGWAIRYLDSIRELDPTKLPIQDINDSDLIEISRDSINAGNARVGQFCISCIQARLNSGTLPDISFLHACKERESDILKAPNVDNKSLAMIYWSLACNYANYAKLGKKSRFDYLGEVVYCLNKIIELPELGGANLDIQLMDIDIWCKVLSQIPQDKLQTFYSKFSVQYDSFVRSLVSSASTDYIHLQKLIEFAAQNNFISDIVQQANWLMACHCMHEQKNSPEKAIEYLENITDVSQIDANKAQLSVDDWYKILGQAAADKNMGKFLNLSKEEKFGSPHQFFSSAYQFFLPTFYIECKKLNVHEKAIQGLADLMRNASYPIVCIVVSAMLEAPVSIFFSNDCDARVKYWEDAIKEFGKRKFSMDGEAEILAKLERMRGRVKLCNPLLVNDMQEGVWEKEISKYKKPAHRLELINDLISAMHESASEVQKQIIAKVCRYLVNNLGVLEAALSDSNSHGLLFTNDFIKTLFGNAEERAKVIATSELRGLFCNAVCDVNKIRILPKQRMQVLWFLTNEEVKSNINNAVNYFCTAVNYIGDFSSISSSDLDNLLDESLSIMSNEALGKIWLQMQMKKDRTQEVYNFCTALVRKKINQQVDITNFLNVCREFGITDNLSLPMRQIFALLSSENVQILFQQAKRERNFEFLALIVICYEEKQLAAGLVEAEDVENAKWQLARYYAESDQVAEHKKALAYCNKLNVAQLLPDELSQMSLRGWCNILTHLSLLSEEARLGFCTKYSEISGDFNKLNIFYVSRIGEILQDKDKAKMIIEFLPEFVRAAPLEKVEEVITGIYSWLIEAPIGNGIMPNMLPDDLIRSLDQAIDGLNERIQNATGTEKEWLQNVCRSDCKKNNGHYLQECLIVIKSHASLCNLARFRDRNFSALSYCNELARVDEKLSMRFMRNLWDLAHSEPNCSDQSLVDNVKRSMCLYVAQKLVKGQNNPIKQDLLKGPGKSLFTKELAMVLLTDRTFLSEAIDSFADLISISESHDMSIAQVQENAVFESYKEYITRRRDVEGQAAFRHGIDCMLQLECSPDLKTRLCNLLCKSSNVGLLGVEQLSLALKYSSPSKALDIIKCCFSQGGGYFPSIVIPAVLNLQAQNAEIFSRLCLEIYGQDPIFDSLSPENKNEIRKGIDLDKFLVLLKGKSIEEVQTFLRNNDKLRDLLRRDPNLEEKWNAVIKRLSENDIQTLGENRYIVFERWLKLHPEKDLFKAGDIVLDSKTLREWCHEWCKVIQYTDPANQVVILKQIFQRVNILHINNTIDLALHEQETEANAAEKSLKQPIAVAALSGSGIIESSDFKRLADLWRAACVGMHNKLDQSSQDNKPYQLSQANNPIKCYQERKETVRKALIAAILCGDSRAVFWGLISKFGMEALQKDMEEFFIGLSKQIPEKEMQTITASNIASAYEGINSWSRKVSAQVPITYVNLAYNIAPEEVPLADSEAKLVRSKWMGKWSVVYRKKGQQKVVSLEKFCIDKENYKDMLKQCNDALKPIEQRDKARKKAPKQNQVAPVDQGNNSHEAGDNIKKFVKQRLMSTAPKLFTRSVLSTDLFAANFAKVVKDTSKTPRVKQVMPAEVSPSEERDLYRALLQIGSNLETVAQDVDSLKLSKVGKEVLLSKRLYAVFGGGERSKVAKAAKNILKRNEVRFAGLRTWWAECCSASYANRHQPAIQSANSNLAIDSQQNQPRVQGVGCDRIISAISSADANNAGRVEEISQRQQPGVVTINDDEQPLAVSLGM